MGTKVHSGKISKTVFRQDTKDDVTKLQSTIKGMRRLQAEGSFPIANQCEHM